MADHTVITEPAFDLQGGSKLQQGSPSLPKFAAFLLLCFNAAVLQSSGARSERRYKQGLWRCLFISIGTFSFVYATSLLLISYRKLLLLARIALQPQYALAEPKFAENMFYLKD